MITGTGPDAPRPEPIPVTGAQRVVGGLLVLPALVATVVTLVVPGVRVLVQSVNGANTRGTGSDGNPYGRLLPSGFFTSLAGSVAALVLPLLIIVGLGLLLGWWLSRASRRGGTVALVLLAVIIAAFAPMVAAVAIRGIVYRRGSRLGTVVVDLPAVLQQVLSTAYAVTGLGLVLAVIIFAVAFRARRAGAVLVAALVVAGGVIGFGLQVFTIPALTARPGADPLSVWVFRRGFQFFDLGGSAAGSVLIFALLAVVGVGMTAVLVAGRARLELVDGADQPRGSVGAVLLVVVLAAMIIVGLVVRATTLTGDVSAGTATAALATLGPTLLPSLVGAVISVGLAAVAAVGIGYLRPLGSASPALLLIFSPWLVVTAVPYLVARLTRRTGTGSTVLTLVPPIGVDVVALVLLSLTLYGLAAQWRATGDRTRWSAMVLRPAVELGVVMLTLRWLWSAHDLLWPLVVGVDPRLRTGPVLLYQVLQQSFGGPGPVAVLFAAPLFVPAAVVLAVLLPRLGSRLRLATGATR